MPVGGCFNLPRCLTLAYKQKQGQPTGVEVRLLPPLLLHYSQTTIKPALLGKASQFSSLSASFREQARCGEETSAQALDTLVRRISYRLTNELTVYFLFVWFSSRIRIQVKQIHRIRTLCACTYFFQGRPFWEMVNRSRCINCFGAWRNWRRIILHEYVSILKIML